MRASRKRVPLPGLCQTPSSPSFNAPRVRRVDGPEERGFLAKAQGSPRVPHRALRRFGQRPRAEPPSASLPAGARQMYNSTDLTLSSPEAGDECAQYLNIQTRPHRSPDPIAPHPRSTHAHRDRSALSSSPRFDPSICQWKRSPRAADDRSPLGKHGSETVVMGSCQTHHSGTGARAVHRRPSVGGSR